MNKNFTISHIKTIQNLLDFSYILPLNIEESMQVLYTERIKSMISETT